MSSPFGRYIPYGGISTSATITYPYGVCVPGHPSIRLQEQLDPPDTEDIDRSIPQLLFAIAVAILLVLVLMTSRAAAF